MAPRECHGSCACTALLFLWRRAMRIYVNRSRWCCTRSHIRRECGWRGTVDRRIWMGPIRGHRTGIRGHRMVTSVPVALTRRRSDRVPWHAGAPKPVVPTEKWWCIAWVKCVFGGPADPCVVLVRGRTNYPANEKSALTRAQKGARGQAIAECEINLKGTAASYIEAEYKCGLAKSEPSWWNDTSPGGG